MKVRFIAVCLIIIVAMLACGKPESEGPLPVAEKGPGSTVLTAFPARPDPTAHYLIYVHGAIVETGGMRPTHPTYGTYEYAAILQSFADRGFTVISEMRREGANPRAEANHIANQVQRLLDNRVPARNLTVVGFSKGGAIAALASAGTPEDEVAWVILAGCSQWVDRVSDAIPHGRVLSLVDTADDRAGSCRPFLSRMAEGSVSDEIILDLGTGHGAFYRPDPVWLEPVIEWAGL